MPAANQRVAAGRGLPPAAVETRPDRRGGITTMSQADGLDGLSRNGGARVSSNGRDWWPVCAGCIPDGWPRRGLHRPARVSQGAARGVEVEKGRAPGFRGEIPGPGAPCDPGGRFPGSLGRERETPAGGGIPQEKGNMTDERIDPIGSVTPGPTCTECRRRPPWAGSLWCEPCYVRFGIMDGTAAFSDAMARLGESAS